MQSEGHLLLKCLQAAQRLEVIDRSCFYIELSNLKSKFCVSMYKSCVYRGNLRLDHYLVSYICIIVIQL